jgi:leader peptidase (prepilin peptidase) / N-methyltransferase
LKNREDKLMQVFIFIFGLLIGSFLNVCIYRIPKGESIAFPPSHCTICSHRIKYFDLIPVFSFIFLKGKCRYCGSKIAIRYPIVELVSGFVILLLYLRYGLSFEWIKYSILVFWVIVIGLIDLDTTDIYFKTTATGILLGLIFIVAGAFNGYSFIEYLLGGAIGGGLIAIIILLTGGMGWGDAEVFLLGGLFIGFKLTLIALFFSFVIGGIIGVLLILLKKKTRKDYIPFAPFISIAFILTILFGDKILNLYLS